MYRRRMLVAALAALLLTALPATAWWMYLRLPAPEAASRDELLRWLVWRDLQQEPLHVQAALIDRLQAEFLDGQPLELDDTSEGLKESYRRQLQANAVWLQQSWFLRRVTQYSALSADQRMQFLRRQLDAVTRWNDLASKIQPTTDPARQSPWEQFLAKVNSWRSESPSTTQSSIDQSIEDGLVCWLSTHDVSTMDLAARTKLALRIADSLRTRPADAGDQRLLLNDQQQQQLTDNAVLLLEAWVRHQAALYAELEPGRQTEFLDDRIELVETSGVLSVIARSRPGGNASPSTASMLHLQQLVNSWIQQTPEPERAQMQQLWYQVQARLLARKLQQWMAPPSQ